MATDSARAAQGADAATPEPQPAAAGDGFVTYDQLRGPELDAGRGARRACPSRPATSTSRWTPTPSWLSATARCA